MNVPTATNPHLHMPLLRLPYLFGALLLALFLSLPTQSATAADNDPDEARQVLEKVAQKMIQTTNARRDDIKEDPRVVEQLVEELLLPHIDLLTASRWVLGRHWRTASKEQKLNFMRHFRGMLLRFYSTALADYLSENTVDEDLIRFQPVRAEAGSDDVTVRSHVHPPNGQPIPVNYHMHLTRKGWQVYDISVEGVSMITTYRNSFNDEIRRNGLDKLIARLADEDSDLVKHPPGANS
ncbi:ABC transporter substrate-binding protein [Thiohalophilus sp.]|uniref:MlaC/ttg2D family ABC transporter substrate-binding protein n=1 Tax=Thiohalophilus sp. TaxID=3028392 RepID=UPI002ACEAD17|nr:ABC transporter substrate-binding protein [Thiohalophilus sp.]MDZ7661529.1 ABC transporter substrate-binding protein [Thiohalophilus sp.]